MSVTVVNDWCFLKDADIEKAMEIIRDYMAYLKEHEPELEQSLWLNSSENPLRYFHIATYKTQEALSRQVNSPGTNRFINRLDPLFDKGSVSTPSGPVIANTGSGPGEV